MNVHRPPHRRLPLWIATLLVGAALATPPVSAQFAWLQVPASCPPGRILSGSGETPQVVACGSLGSFVFGLPGLRYQGDACGMIDGTEEQPALLPVEPAPVLPAGFPCALGSCLGHTPGRPWVAMLDWPNEHGWSVAATIREASDQRLDVELLNLVRAGGVGQWVSSVSDLHVLFELCALAERVRAQPADRPVALNLSFGRHKGTNDDCTAGASLGCAVRQALRQLVVEDGIVAVAAAGNHREMLFPAATQEVLEAGALDLSYYQYAGEPRPSSQTPPGAGALLLGYGLYLSTLGESGGSGGPTTWEAPPGSSYAAAFLTGWLGGTLAGGGTLPQPSSAAADAIWTPVVTAKGLALAYGGAPLPGSELTGPRVLFERALGAPPNPEVPPSFASLKLAGLAPASRPALPVLYADDGNGPQPGVNPCLPCRIDGGGGEHESPDTLVLDLSASAGLPLPMVLEAIWLRVGRIFYAFDRSTDSDLLGKLSTGVLPGLALTGVSGIFPPGEQPSLVLVVDVRENRYWHEVPIQLRP